MDENKNLMILAIVAIVAIVAMVFGYAAMNGSAGGKVVVMSGQNPQPQQLGQFDEQGNVVGQGVILNE